MKVYKVPNPVLSAKGLQKLKALGLSIVAIQAICNNVGMRVEGDEDPYVVGPEVRVGSGHEETPRSGDSFCKVCGNVAAPYADKYFHPEAYVE